MLHCLDTCVSIQRQEGGRRHLPLSLLQVSEAEGTEQLMASTADGRHSSRTQPLRIFGEHVLHCLETNTRLDLKTLGSQPCVQQKL